MKQAPTFGRLMTMVLFALSCFGLLLFLWVSFGGSTPLKPEGYRFRVALPEATQLGLEADVRTAGVSIGKVRKKDIDVAGHPNATVATVEVDPRFAPIASDARVVLRQKTLLGETYLEITPGTRRAPRVPEGGWLPDAQVQDSTQLDEIFDALDPKTRQAFKTWQQDLAGGAAGRGRDLNDALGNLPAFAADADDVLGVLDTQAGVVRRLVRNTGVVFGALTEREDQLATLIRSSNDVFSATSAQQEALATSFRIFPTFLDESKATFARLERFADDTGPLVRELAPALRDLRPAVADLRAASPDLERFFRDLSPLITVARRGLPATRNVLAGTTPLLGELQPFLEELNPILEWLEYHQITIGDFISNGAGALADTIPTRNAFERGHYLRQLGPVGAETAAMYTTRPPASRGNAYLNPGAIQGIERGKRMIFGNFDCANTGKGGDGTYQTKVPDTNDMPSCWVQPAPQVPAGNTRKYPRIVKADYSR
ncbi:MlaD family protein [Paraconexibacter algicola]|uniref:MlaD family protein n=1 Tax=Paraconexibacter algicola TaxID=2133960 RepID=UPI0011B1DF6A|nr:MlaD family protein [Paraconexibacter algicola]